MRRPEPAMIRKTALTTLILAPHADDEVLGAGGLIARLRAEGERVVIAVMTRRQAETPPVASSAGRDVQGEARAAAAVLDAEIRFEDLAAVALDHLPAWKTNAAVHAVVEDVRPRQLLVPFAHDLHRDHAAIAYAGAVAARPYLPLGGSVQRVLAYETLSETHLSPPGLQRAFEPNVFVDIGTEGLSRKLEAMRCYATQLQSEHLPRSIRGLTALATLRGAHIGVEAGEAFMLLHERL